jgi:hypothetical protein
MLNATAIGDQLAHVRARLHAQYDRDLDPRVVDDAVSEATARFENARIQQFVPVLVDRIARDKLRSRKH